MGKKNKKKKAAGQSENPNYKPIAENRKARHKYQVLDTLECGLALIGSEVKSLRLNRVSLDEAYARVQNREVWLVGCDIPEYKQASQMNHAPKRPRKLLMHQSEIRKFAGKAHENGLTLVPLKMYFNHRGIAKCLVGLCRGKKTHDKREALKKADTQRGLQRAMRRR
ncbi:MAG: SsrA-binding protein SmpB [Pirellulales bacterium]|nr:SsrA-binding protein SmpB [Pirellulales bacterium]|tara:strand:+ start:2088 stop:2588 length:501 start_codon:yes stop_codon:yes gene_type:complete